MQYTPKSIRAFIGAKNYEISRNSYQDMGFEEFITSPKMLYFRLADFGFYLQDYFVRDWVDNSMLFLEVENLEKHFEGIKNLNLDKKYKNVRISEIVKNDWGNEFFIHDPSGILWHIGEFKI
ncbi:glyoxalase [Aureibaculum sp. 2210JD6-5]|uniref:glyoxalase n=1 Tax=Aureibaculum sp. 2210JD6-5 TaxID=3103957 RepID=UPI002AAC8EC4|nr:glyoxalase [Aureibaculum sp. 2210JD6-5]MDY7395293.1 glyoxalase [Aureibaculum sp. 2210JD6-5]